MNKELKLQLGSGRRYKEGYVNLDNNKNIKADLYRDVTRGLPCGHNIFDEILTEHFLEHFNGDDFVFIMNECWRTLKPSGILKIIVPDMNFPTAWIDPDHKRFFNLLSFNFWLVADYNSQTAGVQGFFKPLVMKSSDNGELIFEFECLKNEDGSMMLLGTMEATDLVNKVIEEGLKK